MLLEEYGGTWVGGDLVLQVHGSGEAANLSEVGPDWPRDTSSLLAIGLNCYNGVWGSGRKNMNFESPDHDHVLWDIAQQIACSPLDREQLGGYSVGWAGEYRALAVGGNQEQRQKLVGAGLAAIRLLDGGTCEWWDPRRRAGKWWLRQADVFNHFLRLVEATFPGRDSLARRPSDA